MRDGGVGLQGLVCVKLILLLLLIVIIPPNQDWFVGTDQECRHLKGS